MRPSIARANEQFDLRGIPDADIPRPSQLQLIDPRQHMQQICCLVMGGNERRIQGSGILVHPAIWPQRALAENWGLCPFRGGELVPQLIQCRLG